MGVVKIKENIGDGRYQVEVIKNVERAKKRIEQLKKQVEELNKKNTELTKDLDEAKAKENEKRVLYDIEAIKLNDAAGQIEALNASLAAKEAQIISINNNLEIKQNAKTSLESQINSGNFSGQDLADLQSQLIAVNADISALNTQLNTATTEKNDIVKAIEEINNPSKQIKELEKITSELWDAVLRAQSIKSTIDLNKLIIKKKEQIIIDYEETADDVDVRPAWCVDYKVDLEASEEERVSVDINDENELILIAPHTYEPVEKDVEEKETYIAGKLAEKDKLDVEDNELFNKITDKQTEVDNKYIEINGLSLQIAAIDVSLNPEEQQARRLFLQEQIDTLREEIKKLNKEIIKLKREKEKNRSKATLLTTLILRLNDELTDLTTALSSPERILTPKVTEKTRRFQPTQSSSPEAVFYNKSLLPGFQKWKPSFRLGVITAINQNDLCSVTLEPAISSQQDLNINQHQTLENVRIKYGSCNSAAFNVGDRVVVEFSEREQDRPTVIGFEDNPKPCGAALTFANSDGELGAYPNSSIYGSIGTPPYQKWLSCNLVNRFSQFPQPRVVKNYYAGRQYWFDGEVSAISWHEKTLYIRGRFYTFTDSDTTILAAALWQMPDPNNIEINIKVLIVLTLTKTTFSRETNLRFLAYTNNPDQQDALNITELRKLSLPVEHKTHLVSQGHFTQDGSSYVYWYEESDIQHVKKLTFTYTGDIIVNELFTLAKQKVGAPSFSGSGSDERNPPAPTNPDPSAYISWSSSSSTTANYNVISAGGDINNMIVTDGKVFYFYLRIDSYHHSITTTVDKTGFYRGTTPLELTVNINESSESITTATLRMGVYDLVNGSHDANAWVVDTESGSGSGTNGSSSTKTYFPENRPNGQYTGETVIYNEDYFTNKVLYISLVYDSINDVFLFVKANVDYELSSTSTHAFDFDGNESIIDGTSSDTATTTYEIILNRKKGGGVIDQYIDNTNLLRDISSPMNISHGGIGFGAANAYVLGAYFRLATGLSKLYGVDLVNDSEPAYIKTWNLDGGVIRAQDIYPVIT